MIFTSLPLFTISEELLCAMLRRSEASQEETEQILKFRLDYRTAMIKLLQTQTISLEIPDLTEENFSEASLTLGLSQLFYEKEVFYTYAEYQEHLRQTRAFADSYANCTLKAEPNQTFRNISFSVIYGKCVIVSKNSRPTIHFMIYHSRLLYAFEHFVPPMRENKKTDMQSEQDNLPSD